MPLVRLASVSTSLEPHWAAELCAELWPLEVADFSIEWIELLPILIAFQIIWCPVEEKTVAVPFRQYSSCKSMEKGYFSTWRLNVNYLQTVLLQCT